MARGKNYAGVGGAASGTDKTMLTLITAATIRPEIHYFSLGSSAAVGDTAALMVLQRFTAVGTEGGGFTPIALDPANPAALSDCGVGVFSVEPTYTASAILWKQAFNQRATVQWWAAPGEELIAPATANNGIGIKSVSSTSTQTIDCCLHWNE